MASVLITGGNRGVGLEWVRHFGKKGWRVFATCRHPAEADALVGEESERGVTEEERKGDTSWQTVRK